MAAMEQEQGMQAGGGEMSPDQALGEAGKLINNVNEGLTMIGQMLAAVKPDLAGPMEELIGAFQGLMDQASLDSPGGAKAKGAEPVPVESGAGGAVPVSPQGVQRR